MEHTAITLTSIPITYVSATHQLVVCSIGAAFVLRVKQWLKPVVWKGRNGLHGSEMVWVSQALGFLGRTCPGGCSVAIAGCATPLPILGTNESF